MAYSNPPHDYTTTIPTRVPSKARLDHIIILVPYKDLLNVPEWLTSQFTITPGGRHADGKTENKLILFHDGSYIELIAFINDDPKLRKGHWWGDKQIGIIDYAFTTDGDARAHWKAIQARLAKLDPDLAARYQYDPPVAGGRRRPDGVEVKWEVTFPKGVERGELPFFCHDVTPRERRVPFSKEACTHPCLAYGIKQLVVMVPSQKAEDLSVVYSALLGQGHLVNEGGAGRFIIDTVRKVEQVWLPELHLHPHLNYVEGGFLLGDLMLGGISAEGNAEPPVRLDSEEDYGRISIALQLPPESGVECKDT